MLLYWIIEIHFKGDSVVAFIGIAALYCCFDSFNFKTAKRLKRNQMSNCNTISSINAGILEMCTHWYWAL
jgi:hypothetical protein